jgi:hypothetical protein
VADGLLSVGWTSQPVQPYAEETYMSLPIAITVEGANIMTRSFQIIGQGLTRCHPHMSDLLKALQLPAEEEKQGVETFVKQFYKIIGHGTTNFFGLVTKGVTSSVSTMI